jgi:hypothetical protein
MAQQFKLPQVVPDTIIMQGGVDQMTPIMQLKSGVLRDAMNFEASILGGYSRIGGYERYDGTALASVQTYQTIFITGFINVPLAGQTLTGATSGATGYILEVGPNYLAITAVTGTFTTSEVVKVGAAVIGTATTPSVTSPAEQAAHTALAANYRRALIAAVPGSGPVRGVFVFNDIVHAFRDNVGGTATLLYKASGASWVNIPYLNEISFTAGTTVPTEGATLTQGGVTATLKRAVLQSGVWQGSASGRLIITAPAGGSFAAGSATIGTTTITLSGTSSAITFATGGRFEVVAGNFSGQSTSYRAYGCDGTNRCWEFDGTILVPIATGFTPDTPKHISIHKNFLFISILGSLGFSAPGLPYDWTAIDGAGVIAFGENITNLLELPGSQATATMGIWTQQNTFMLYGTGQSSWNPVPFNTGTGGFDYTAENMAHSYVFDAIGIIDLQTVLNYGNFSASAITYNVNPFIIKERSKAIASCLCRTKSQYRLFFSDGYALFSTNIQGQYGQANSTYNMPVLFPNPVTCVQETKLATGEEVLYFGSTNGYVYKMDSGTSFDGLPINAWLTFVTNSVGSPQTEKHFRHARIEAIGQSYFNFMFGYVLGYGTQDIVGNNKVQYENATSTPYWDSFIWDQFTWDGGSIVPTDCDMQGDAENYAISINSSSDAFYPFSVNSIIVNYSPRRIKR